MTVLSVALLALLASFSSGAVALRRAGHLSTAAALAEKQMELYRRLRFLCIRLEPTSIPSTTPYTSDTAYSSSQITTTSLPGFCPNTGLPDEWNASREVTSSTAPASPDGYSYRVDTYVVWYCPTGTLTGTADVPLCLPAPGLPAARPVKRVTVVVRDLNALATSYARTTSTFDASADL